MKPHLGDNNLWSGMAITGGGIQEGGGSSIATGVTNWKVVWD